MVHGVKPPLVVPAPLMQALAEVLAVALLIQFAMNVPEEAADDRPSLAPDTHMGNPNSVLGFWLWPAPNPAIYVTWG